jgi:hypothetical protein
VRSVASIGRWSARRPRRAIALWLTFVTVAAAIGVVSGIVSLDNGAVGESARGYDLIAEHEAWGPAREYAYLHSEKQTASMPTFQAAIDDLRTRMSRALGNVEVRFATDPHTALVSGQWTHPVSIDALRASVLAAGSAHPQIQIEETGDTSSARGRSGGEGCRPTRRSS